MDDDVVEADGAAVCRSGDDGDDDDDCDGADPFVEDFLTYCQNWSIVGGFFWLRLWLRLLVLGFFFPLLLPACLPMSATYRSHVGPTR